MFQGLYIMLEALHAGPETVYSVAKYCFKLNTLYEFGPKCFYFRYFLLEKQALIEPSVGLKKT
jgi:hypothetical protein